MGITQEEDEAIALLQAEECLHTDNRGYPCRKCENCKRIRQKWDEWMEAEMEVYWESIAEDHK